MQTDKSIAALCLLTEALLRGNNLDGINKNTTNPPVEPRRTIVLSTDESLHIKMVEDSYGPDHPIDQEELIVEAELCVEGELLTMAHGKCTKPVVLNDKAVRVYFEIDSFKELQESHLPKNTEGLEMRVQTLLWILTGSNDSRPLIYKKYSTEEISIYLDALMKLGARLAGEHHMLIGFEQENPEKVTAKLSGADILYIPSIDLWDNNDVKHAIATITESVPDSNGSPLDSISEETIAKWKYASFSATNLSQHEEMVREQQLATKWLELPRYRNGRLIAHFRTFRFVRLEPIPNNPLAIILRIDFYQRLLGGPPAPEIANGTAENMKNYCEFLHNFQIMLRVDIKFFEVKFSNCHRAIDRAVSRGGHTLVLPGPNIYFDVPHTRWMAFLKNTVEYANAHFRQHTCFCCGPDN